MRDTERRRRIAHETLTAARTRTINQSDVSEALSDFDALWRALTSPERHEVLTLLVERIDYDGGTGGMELVFRDDGAPLMEGGEG